MKRWVGLVALLALVGCGGGNGGSGALNSRLSGTWTMTQQSTDGGYSYSTVTNGFQFAFFDNGTWGDSDGDGGTWSTYGNVLTIQHTDTSKPNESFPFALENGDQQLRLWVTDNNGTPQRVSVYTRQTSLEIIRSLARPTRADGQPVFKP